MRYRESKRRDGEREREREREEIHIGEKKVVGGVRGRERER